MLKKLTFDFVGPAAKMQLDFAPRLNLLTGDNGLGKSFILDVAWWSLSRTWAGSQAWPQLGHGKKARIGYTVQGKAGKSSPQNSTFDLSAWAWKLGKGRPAQPGLVIYARVDGGFAVWDPARNSPQYDPFPSSRQESQPVESFVFSKDTLWDGLEQDGRVLCNGLLRDWVSWQQKVAEEYTALCNVLEVLSPSADERLTPGEPTRLSPHDARDVPTLDLPYGRIPLPHASAGMRRILALAYLLVWSWYEHRKAAALRGEKPSDRIVLLIDELEAHLHPRWQRLILPALLTVVKKLQASASVQVIAATHAPLMLASVESEFDAKTDALFLFDLVKEGKQQTVKVSKVEWVSRGDANSYLTSEPLDLKEARSLEAESAIESAKVALRKPHLPIGEVRQIHHRLRSVLGDTDPFWPRWLVRAEAAGIEP